MLDQSRDNTTEAPERELPPPPKTSDELMSPDAQHFRGLIGSQPPPPNTTEWQDYQGALALEAVEKATEALRLNPYASEAQQAEWQRIKSRGAQDFAKAQDARKQRLLRATTQQFASESSAWLQQAEEERK